MDLGANLTLLSIAWHLTQSPGHLGDGFPSEKLLFEV